MFASKPPSVSALFAAGGNLFARALLVTRQPVALRAIFAIHVHAAQKIRFVGR